MRTAHAAALLGAAIVSPSTDLPPVWPDKDGHVCAKAFYLLDTSIPGAALGNPALQELLALFEALRDGSQRKRALTSIHQRLGCCFKV